VASVRNHRTAVVKNDSIARPADKLRRCINYRAWSAALVKDDIASLHVSKSLEP
jgi:hypothetical protein